METRALIRTIWSVSIGSFESFLSSTLRFFFSLLLWGRGCLFWNKTGRQKRRNFKNGERGKKEMEGNPPSHHQAKSRSSWLFRHSLYRFFPSYSLRLFVRRKKFTGNWVLSLGNAGIGAAHTDVTNSLIAWWRFFLPWFLLTVTSIMTQLVDSGEAAAIGVEWLAMKTKPCQVLSRPRHKRFNRALSSSASSWKDRSHNICV